MPYAKLQFKPGINREVTSYTNEGGWFDGDKIRFRFGFPEKIKGWVKQSSNSFLGSCRALLPWVTLNQDRYIGVGTSVKYYINRGGGYNDITPLRETTTAGAVTFTATDGDYVLEVSDTAHGAVEGDFVTFSGAASLGGNITAGVLNQEYQIVNVVNANTYHVEARLAGTSISSITVNGNLAPTYVTANASDSGNGGASVVGAYQINTGLDTTVFGAGWGVGPWSRGTWGSASTGGLAINTLRLWSHDPYGEDLLMNVRDGGIYYWDASAGLATRAVALNSLAGSNTAPTIAKQILVSDRDRHVIAFGCDPEGNPGVQDPGPRSFAPWKPASKFWCSPTPRSTRCSTLALRSHSGSGRFRKAFPFAARTAPCRLTTWSSGWAATSSMSTAVLSSGCLAPCATTSLTTSMRGRRRRLSLASTPRTQRSGGSTRRPPLRASTATWSTTTLSSAGTTETLVARHGLIVAF
jgi:hypothetical protein